MGAGGSKEQTAEVFAPGSFFGSYYQNFTRQEIHILCEFFVALGILSRGDQVGSFFMSSRKDLTCVKQIQEYLSRKAPSSFDPYTSKLLLSLVKELDGHAPSRLYGLQAFIKSFHDLFKRQGQVSINNYCNIFEKETDIQEFVELYIRKYASSRWPPQLELTQSTDVRTESTYQLFCRNVCREILYATLLEVLVDYSQVYSYFPLLRLPVPPLLKTTLRKVPLLLDATSIFYLVTELPYFQQQQREQSKREDKKEDFLRSPLPQSSDATLEEESSADWSLLFSSEAAGSASWTHFLECVLHTGPLLIVIKDSDGFVFGGLVDTSVQSQSQFQGSYQCALFTLKPQRNIFLPSQYNDHYFYLNHGMQSFPSGIVISKLTDFISCSFLTRYSILGYGGSTRIYGLVR